MFRRVTVIRNGKQSHIMAKSGPKKKPGERYPSGDLKPAAAEKLALEVGKWQRMKMGATEANWRDQEWSSPLGQLRMRAKVANADAEGLSQEQYLALKRYVMARHRHRMAQGYPPESPKSIAGELVAGGGGSGPDMDDEAVYALRRDYNGARSALLEYAGRGVEYTNVCDDLARDDETAINRLGVAREAANILRRWWGMA